MMRKKTVRKTFLGMPMSWDTKRPFRNAWNEDNDKIFLPKSFGIGWTINVCALLRRAGIEPRQPKRKAESREKEGS